MNDSRETKKEVTAAVPYTCLIDNVKLQSEETPDDYDVVIRKCKCGSVWCPICFKTNKSKTISTRMRRMDWRFVRHVVLTVDPGRYPDPEAAYLEIREKKAIPQIVHNLDRTKHRFISDWLWCLEFHRSGHPHWHVFFEVEHQGKEGMLTGDVLRQYWGYGAVREDYMHNENHWNAFTTYFGSKGYFSKDKAHQARLPEWALKYQTPIRRTGSKRIPKETAPDQKETNELKRKQRERLKNIRNNRELKGLESLAKNHGLNGDLDYQEQRPYEVILNSCGDSADCMVISDGFMMGCKIHFPYAVVKQAYVDKGRFEKGVGFVVHMSELEFFIFNETFLLQRAVSMAV